MAELELPRYIIKQLCMPGGLRTSKKPVMIIPAKVNRRGFDRSNDEGSFPLLNRLFIPFHEEGRFSSWEYRFWAMQTVNNEIHAECRCCGAKGGVRTLERQQHHKQAGCTTKLCKIYQKLLKDRICIICDCITSRQKWGVHICSNACEQAWCEIETTPMALKFELTLLKD
jgi:hypothetical protein